MTIMISTTFLAAASKWSMTYGTKQGRFQSSFLRFYMFLSPPQLEPPDPPAGLLDTLASSQILIRLLTPSSWPLDPTIGL